MALVDSFVESKTSIATNGSASGLYLLDLFSDFGSGLSPKG